MEQKIKMEKMVSFLASPAGRWTRALAGLSMVAYGLSRKNALGYTIAGIGVGPLMAGSFDFCILGPALGGAFKGSELRAILHQQRGFPQLGGEPSSWLNA